MRQSLRPGEDSLRPGCGWLPDSWMPHEMMRKALRSAARDGSGPTLFEYGPAQGADTLRGLITRRLLDQGVDAVPDQVMITDSCTQAIDLVCRFLLEPGDTVLVDDPCYFNFKALLRAHRANVVGVPVHGERSRSVGVCIDAGSASASHLYHQLGPAEPDRRELDRARRASLVETVRAVRTGDRRGRHLRRLRGTSPFRALPRSTAWIGSSASASFSKTLSASMRCGYIACRPDWMRGLADLRMVTGMASSPLNAELVASMLMDGSYRRHVERIRARLAQQRQLVKTKLAKLGIVPWIEPAGGMFLWCELPDGADAADVARRALAENVVLAPGNAFSVSGAATSFVRFNVTQMEGDKVYAALRRASPLGPPPRRGSLGQFFIYKNHCAYIDVGRRCFRR